MSKARGFNGEIEFDGTFVILRPIPGFLGKLRDKNRGERRFAVKNIMMLDYSNPSGIKAGYIRILTAGMTALRGNPMRPAFLDAAEDPNAIVFKARDRADVSRVRDEIDLAIANG